MEKQRSEPNFKHARCKFTLQATLSFSEFFFALLTLFFFYFLVYFCFILFSSPLFFAVAKSDKSDSIAQFMHLCVGMCVCVSDNSLVVSFSACNYYYRYAACVYSWFQCAKCEV